MPSLISCLCFLSAATMDETQSVGSETVVTTPLFCMLSSSTLTGACIATRTQCAGWPTGYTVGSSVVEYVIGSFPSSSLNMSLYCVWICVVKLASSPCWSGECVGSLWQVLSAHMHKIPVVALHHATLGKKVVYVVVHLDNKAVWWSPQSLFCCLHRPLGW